MKIGYIVLCHKDPELVAKLIKRVLLDTDNIAIVHVDLAMDIASFKEHLKSTNNVYFLEKRWKAYWAGFNVIDAMMAGLSKALDFNCDRYVLLQMPAYSIKSNEEIDAFFTKYSDIEFIRGVNITKSNNPRQYMKCYGYHIYDNIDRSKKSIKTLFSRALTGFNKIGIKYRRGYFYDRNQKKKYEIYWGWAHFALTKECVKYILQEYQNQSLNRYFKHIFAPDESYIHTILFNSPFASKTMRGGEELEKDVDKPARMLTLMYFEYPGIIKGFSTKEEIEAIDGRYLYVRKISTDNDFI